jgi:hypothetical protein
MPLKKPKKPSHPLICQSINIKIHHFILFNRPIIVLNHSSFADTFLSLVDILRDWGNRTVGGLWKTLGVSLRGMAVLTR